MCCYFPNTVFVPRPVCLSTLPVLACPLQRERDVKPCNGEMVYVIGGSQGDENVIAVPWL